MGLMDGIKKEAGEVVEAGKKKHNNSDYQKKARARALAAANTVNDYIKANIKGELPQDVKDALDVLLKVRKPAAGGNFGTPIFNKIFGETPKVGDKVTSLKIFEETGKGFAEMRKLIKKWAEQGNVVEYDETAKAYIIKKLA